MSAGKARVAGNERFSEIGISLSIAMPNMRLANVRNLRRMTFFPHYSRV